MFIGREPSSPTAKPLPPVWDAVNTKWIGPDCPEYPGFYDDTEEAVADLEGR